MKTSQVSTLQASFFLIYSFFEVKIDCFFCLKFLIFHLQEVHFIFQIFVSFCPESVHSFFDHFNYLCFNNVPTVESFTMWKWKWCRFWAIKTLFLCWLFGKCTLAYNVCNAYSLSKFQHVKLCFSHLTHELYLANILQSQIIMCTETCRKKNNNTTTTEHTTVTLTHIHTLRVREQK